jgi:hypothetical protein
VFAASLVILMNQFSSLYYTEEYGETMQDAINIVTYCAEIDPQALRVLDIITRFSEVVTKWTKDHAYAAPPLSADFSCLYNQPVRSGPASDHMHPGVAVNAGIQRRSSSQAVSGPDPGLLTPPSIPKVSLHHDILSTQAPSLGIEARANGMTPPHIHIPPASLVGRSSVSAHSSIASSEPLSGNIEFEFDGLWNSFINHLPPVSSVAPGISSLALQFPPPVIGAPTEPYGAYFSLRNSDTPPVRSMKRSPVSRTSLLTHGAALRQARLLNVPHPRQEQGAKCVHRTTSGTGYPNRLRRLTTAVD